MKKIWNVYYGRLLAGNMRWDFVGQLEALTARDATRMAAEKTKDIVNSSPNNFWARDPRTDDWAPPCGWARFGLRK
jgi:hypothetical protein